MAEITSIPDDEIVERFFKGHSKDGLTNLVAVTEKIKPKEAQLRVETAISNYCISRRKITNGFRD